MIARAEAADDAERMRVLAVTLRWPPFVAGGYELFTRETVLALREHGHEVTVLCGRATGLCGEEGVLPWLLPAIDGDADLFARSQEAPNAERFRLHFLRLANWSATLRALETSRADVLFFFNLGLASLAPVLAARCRGVPTLGYVGDLWPLCHWVSAWRDRSADEKPLRLAALTRAWRVFRGLVGMGRMCVPSRFVAERLVEDGIPAIDVLVLPHGLGPDMDERARRVSPRPRAAGEPLRVISSSMLWSGKGQHVLLEACARAAEGGVDLEVALAGSGPKDYRRKLEELASSPALSGRVRFLGMLSKDELSGELAAAHVFAFPSLWGEPFGLATLEAMAHALPALASDAGATPEIVRDGREGLLVPAGDVDALARGLERLFRDEGLRSQLGGAARERVRSDFGHEPFLDGIERELALVRRRGAR